MHIGLQEWERERCEGQGWGTEMGGAGYGGSHMSKEMNQTHSFPGHPSQKHDPSATILPVQPQATLCTATDILGSQPGHTHSPTDLSAPPLTGQARWDLSVTRDCWAP